MSYAEVTVIVEGAVDQAETFQNSRSVERLVNDLHKECRRHKLKAEVYINWHEHSLRVEDCACAQYELSHKPDFVFDYREA